MNPIEEYHNVSYSQLSIARHYGAIDVNGSRYAYYPNEDRLVRVDIVKKRVKEQKEQARQFRQAQKALQSGLDL